MSNNKRTPLKPNLLRTAADPLSPGSFVTPPPTNLYGASSQSSQATDATDVTEVLSQATDVLDDLPTPPLSPVASPRASSSSSAEMATPGVSRLKRTADPGFRGNPLYPNATGRYMYRPDLNDPSKDYPSDAYGNPVSENSEERYPLQNAANVGSTIANLSLATPISQRNPTARAAASDAPVLSLTPKRKRPNQNNGDRNGKNGASGGKRRTLRKQRKQRTLRKQRKQRKQRKGTQRKHKRKQSRR